jgi:hypothetical protein
MSRTVTISTLMYQHVSWEEDSLVVKIARHKDDQEGKHFLPKHIYAS